MVSDHAILREGTRKAKRPSIPLSDKCMLDRPAQSPPSAFIALHVALSLSLLLLVIPCIHNPLFVVVKDPPFTHPLLSTTEATIHDAVSFLQTKGLQLILVEFAN